MGLMDMGIGSIIESVGKVADNLFTSDKERLDVELQKQELLLKDKELLLKDKEIGFKAINDENINTTQRWQGDMNSDSWLSKNIRPLTLIYILSAYTVFSVGSAFNISVTQEYVELMGQWGMLIMSAYFGGRTIEKVMQLKSK